MLKKVYNHDRMKKENMLSVLRCIQEYGPISRREVKEITGLAWGTVSGIVNDLLLQKIIQEEPDEIKGRGRNPGRLDIAVGKNCIIGMDINGAGITITLMDLKCNVHTSYFESVKEFSKEAVLAQIYSMMDSIIEKNRMNDKQILGIGIAMQGSVDSIRGVSVYCPYFKDWNDVPLMDLLVSRYDLPTVVRHSPDCMALYATWFGIAKGARDFLFIRLGEAIGMSIMMDGIIYRGFNGNAGEIGHMIVAPEGKKCNCGRNGCLETVASEKGIREYVLAGLNAGRESIVNSMIFHQSYEDIDMDVVYRAYMAGDELCIEAVDQMAYYLGISLANVINLFNPEMIVLGGSLVNYEALFIEKVRKTVKESVWGNSDVLILTMMSQAKVNTAAMGACIDVIEEILNGDIEMEQCM